MPGPEKVLTVHDYWDGPKSGVANFNGRPHAYECVFDDRLDEWSWFYLLNPMDQGTLQLVMERWQIWLRWVEAHQTGQTTIGTHPALPADRPRWEELTRMLNSKLEVPASSDLAANGEFERSVGQVPQSRRRLRGQLLTEFPSAMSRRSGRYCARRISIRISTRDDTTSLLPAHAKLRE